MNYRHAYHAGNFADVLKHIVLTLAIEHLKLKPQPFRVIDVHAGIGLYDLEGVEAGKTNEWQQGIKRIVDTPLDGEVALFLAPYLNAVRIVNRDGALKSYPGSPLLARALMRPGDQLIANELHPEDFAKLKDVFGATRDTKVLNLDAWVALKSLLPPKERRGVILIDPPFEKENEFASLAAGVAEALRRFENGIYIVWYPIKSPPEVTGFLKSVRGHAIKKALNVTLSVCRRGARAGLTETGVIVLNPPYQLKDRLEAILPGLAVRMSEGAGSGFTIEDWTA